MDAPAPSGDDRAAAEIEVLVAQVLDDLDEGRLGLEAALRRLALAAWEMGRRVSPRRS